jgi:hypothetical protein
MKTVKSIGDVQAALEQGKSCWYSGRLAPQGVAISAVPSLVGRCSFQAARQAVETELSLRS